MTPADLIARVKGAAKYCELVGNLHYVATLREAASALTAQAERIASLEKMLADESRDARSIAHSLEVACGLLDTAVGLLRESLDEGGVDVGFDERLAEFWQRHARFDPATVDVVAAIDAAKGGDRG